MKKILLIVIQNTVDETTSFLGVNEYLGIGYIKAYLCQQGYNADICVISYKDEIDIKNFIPDPPLLVGFAVYSDNILQSLQIAQKIKQEYSNTHITLGGPQVNNFEVQILQENPQIDTVISYEGEKTFSELVSALYAQRDLDDCLGISYRDRHGKIHVNNPRDPILDLDSFPYPSRDIHEKVHQKFLYIAGSRGCLGNCAFCGETSAKKYSKPKYVRSRSADSIVNEIEYLVKKYNIFAYRMTDATFEDPGEEGFIRANAIFDKITSRKLCISLHLFTRGELVVNEPDEYFQKARRAGTECFYIGVESGNNTDLKLYNKKTSVDINQRAIRKIQDAGIHVGIGFICFNPFSTHKQLLDNVQFIKSTHLGHVFYLLQTRLEVLPQSNMRKILLKTGLADHLDYRTHFYDYRFKDPSIGELFEVIRSAYTMPPIYYMDTLLGMDRTFTYFKIEGAARTRIMELFQSLNSLCETYRERNYNFFLKCIDMSANGAHREHMEKLARDAKLNDIYKPYLELYNKINVRVTKERMRIYSTEKTI